MRRLIVFSDPGGAKPCLSLAKNWQASDELLVCSDRQYAFFETFVIPVRQCRGEDARAIFDEFRPDSLLTGTSYTSRIEMDFVHEAAKRGIPSASFVDHYTGFDVRFGTAEARIFPDEIHVIDEKAAALARELGLAPQEQVGHPLVAECVKDTADEREYSTHFSIATHWLLDEHHVATVPGSAFGAPGSIRLSFACSEAEIGKAMARMQKGLGSLA